MSRNTPLVCASKGAGRISKLFTQRAKTGKGLRGLRGRSRGSFLGQSEDSKMQIFSERELLSSGRGKSRPGWEAQLFHPTVTVTVTSHDLGSANNLQRLWFYYLKMELS